MIAAVTTAMDCPECGRPLPPVPVKIVSCTPVPGEDVVEVEVRLEPDLTDEWADLVCEQGHKECF